MFRRREGDHSPVLQDPLKVRVLTYLAQERAAAVPKIGFDLKVGLSDLGKALRELQDEGLVEEVHGTAKQAPQVQGPPGGQGTYILTEHGLQLLRQARERGTFLR